MTHHGPWLMFVPLGTMLVTQLGQFLLQSLNLALGQALGLVNQDFPGFGNFTTLDQDSWYSSESKWFQQCEKIQDL